MAGANKVCKKITPKKLTDQAAEIATDFAELILGKDEAKRIAEKINAFVKR